MNPIEEKIRAKLEKQFHPTFMEVVNESFMHSVPKGSESHFKITLASPNFGGMRQVARHQAIYSALAEELEGSVHALALHTFSPEEWSVKSVVPDSPQCLGGSKHK